MLTMMVVLAVAAAQPVTIRFAGIVGSRPFQCGQVYAVGTPATNVRPTDLRFYVMDVALIDVRGKAVPLTLAADGLWQQPGLALVDLEDGSGPCRGGNAGLHEAIKGTVPKGDYRGLRFRIGLPEGPNHGDASVAKAPLNFTAMFWSWQAGYRFFKADLETVAAPVAAPAMAEMPGMAGMDNMRGRQTGFAVHIGSTGCGMSGGTARPAAACTQPNRALVTLPGFDVAKNIVVVDLAALLAGTDVGHNAPGTAPGCMSAPDDPDCGPVFAAFGLGSGAQRVFGKR